MHEYFLTNGRLDICVSQKRNKSALKDVLDFYLQSHQGAGTLISGSTKKMPMIQGYNCPNMNDFWYGFTEICTTRETLTKNFVILFKDVLYFDLQSHRGARTLGSDVMMLMSTLQGNYVLNISAFWSMVTEIHITGENLIKTLSLLRTNEEITNIQTD